MRKIAASLMLAFLVGIQTGCFVPIWSPNPDHRVRQLILSIRVVSPHPRNLGSRLGLRYARPGNTLPHTRRRDLTPRNSSAAPLRRKSVNLPGMLNPSGWTSRNLRI